MRRIKIYTLFFVAALYLVSLSGCKKSEDTNQPALPSSASMEMDGLASFSSQKKSALATNDSSNFLIAYVFVTTWKTIADISLAVPVAIYKEALKNGAVYADSLWTWTYTIKTSTNEEFKAVLTGKVEGDTSIFWTMRVSSIGSITTDYNNFKWYEGRSHLKYNGGWWKFYDLTNKGRLLVEWNNTDESSKWIKYTNITDGDTDKGNYIKYGLANDPTYNAYFSVYVAGESKTVKIDWNKTSHEGRITAEQRGIQLFQVSWDATLKNK
jgi:hypothetical protein